MENELQQLERERNNMTTRIFRLGLEIAAIFAVPAFLVLLLGRRLSGNGVYILLVITFVLSWFAVIIRWNKIRKKAYALDAKIRELKQNITEQKQSEIKIQ